MVFVYAKDLLTLMVNALCAHLQICSLMEMNVFSVQSGVKLVIHQLVFATLARTIWSLLMVSVVVSQDTVM